MRGLGDSLRIRKRSPEAIECYRLALAINPFFPKHWYNLGCLAMSAEPQPLPDLAAEAFR